MTNNERCMNQKMKYNRERRDRNEGMGGVIDREKVEGREGESKVDSTPSRQGHNRIDIEGTSTDDVLHEHEGVAE